MSVVETSPRQMQRRWCSPSVCLSVVLLLTVRQSPMPSAPSSLALLASSGVSALALTDMLRSSSAHLSTCTTARQTGACRAQCHSTTRLSPPSLPPSHPGLLAAACLSLLSPSGSPRRRWPARAARTHSSPRPSSRPASPRRPSSAPATPRKKGRRGVRGREAETRIWIDRDEALMALSPTFPLASVMVSFLLLTSISWQPDTQHLPMPRATTAAWLRGDQTDREGGRQSVDTSASAGSHRAPPAAFLFGGVWLVPTYLVMPPCSVRMPSAAFMPWMSSAVVSLRTRIT